MDKSALFTDRDTERHADPALMELLVERVAIWNRPLAYLLSAAVFFAIGFFGAAQV